MIFGVSFGKYLLFDMRPGNVPYVRMLRRMPPGLERGGGDRTDACRTGTVRHILPLCAGLCGLARSLDSCCLVLVPCSPYLPASTASIYNLASIPISHPSFLIESFLCQTRTYNQLRVGQNKHCCSPVGAASVVS